MSKTGERTRSITCPVGILQGLWVRLLRPSLLLPSRVEQWIQSMCTPQLLQTATGGSCNTEMWNGQLGAEHASHTAEETALGQQWNSYRLKALPLPQTFFFYLACMNRRQFWFYIWISDTSQNVACAPGPAPFVLALTPPFSWKAGLYLNWEGSWGDRSDSICEFVQVMLNVWPDLSKSFTLPHCWAHCCFQGSILWWSLTGKSCFKHF